MFTPVKLDKTRNVMLGFQALRLFKKTTGKSLMKVDFESEDVEDLIPTIFYCGMIHEDKELTLDKTIELIDEHLGIKGAMELLPKILEELVPEESIKNTPGAVKTKKSR